MIEPLGSAYGWTRTVTSVLPLARDPVHALLVDHNRIRWAGIDVGTHSKLVWPSELWHNLRH